MRKKVITVPVVHNHADGSSTSHTEQRVVSIALAISQGQYQASSCICSPSTGSAIENTVSEGAISALPAEIVTAIKLLEDHFLTGVAGADPADVQMTTYGDLREYVQDNHADGVSSKNARVYERIVRQALRRLCREHDWEFWKDSERINFFGPFSGGTVSMTQGSNVFTLNGGPTWPADILRRNIVFANNSEVEFEPVTLDNPTQITARASHI